MFKSKISYITDKESNAMNLQQSQDSIIVRVIRGKNQLKFESVSNYFESTKEDAKYYIDLLFSYKNHLLYTVTDENYWCPTCERIIKKHYTSSSNKEIKEIINSYRDTMSYEGSSFEELIRANYPIIKLLPSGKYTLSLRGIFPTFGENEVFSGFADKILTASLDSYYSDLDEQENYIHVDASTSYMLPTQTRDAYSEDTLNKYRKKEYIGRGLVIQLSGFLGCLLDGHHKAEIAYERKQALECLVIESFFENRIYTGIGTKNTALNFCSIPTIHEYCCLQSFITNNEISSAEDLLALLEEVKINKDILFYEEMEQLIVSLNTFMPKKLIELYNIVLENYSYKSLRIRYFKYLASLEKTENIEELMLNFLINDDYENKQLTQLCEDYFR